MVYVSETSRVKDVSIENMLLKLCDSCHSFFKNRVIPPGTSVCLLERGLMWASSTTDHVTRVSSVTIHATWASSASSPTCQVVDPTFVVYKPYWKQGHSCPLLQNTTRRWDCPVSEVRARTISLYLVFRPNASLLTRLPLKRAQRHGGHFPPLEPVVLANNHVKSC